MTNFFIVFTQLGDWKVILVLTVILSVLFWLYLPGENRPAGQKRNLLLPLWAAVLGSGIMTTIIKYIVNRPRPLPTFPGYLETGPSFPSAHATFAFVLFGFLIYVIWRFYPNLNLAVKIVSTVLLALIIILIGYSRLYLGVHYLSDILAGYLVGLLWFIVAIYISRKKI